MKTDEWARKKLRDDAIRWICSDDHNLQVAGQHLEAVLDDLQEIMAALASVNRIACQYLAIINKPNAR